MKKILDFILTNKYFYGGYAIIGLLVIALASNLTVSVTSIFYKPKQQSDVKVDANQVKKLTSSVAGQRGKIPPMIGREVKGSLDSSEIVNLQINQVDQNQRDRKSNRNQKGSKEGKKHQKKRKRRKSHFPRGNSSRIRSPGSREFQEDLGNVKRENELKKSPRMAKEEASSRRKRLFESRVPKSNSLIEHSKAINQPVKRRSFMNSGSSNQRDRKSRRKKHRQSKFHASSRRLPRNGDGSPGDQKGDDLKESEKIINKKSYFMQ